MMMSPNSQEVSPPFEDEDLKGYGEATIEEFWNSFGSEDHDHGLRRKLGFSDLERRIKRNLVSSYLRKKEFGDLFLLCNTCLEIQTSEEAFRSDLRDRNGKFIEIPQEQRQPYIDHSETTAFEKLNVDDGFLSEDGGNRLIQEMCDAMVSHVTDPGIGTKLIITTANADNFSKICMTSKPTISAQDSLAILPAQRTARYKSLLDTVIKEAAKLNKAAITKGKAKPISDETMKKLEETYKQVSQFVTLVNESIRFQEKGHPLKKEEIEALLMLTRQNILIDENQKEEAIAALPEIANIIVMGEQSEGDVVEALRTNGFIVDDKAIEKVQAIRKDLYERRKQEFRQMFKDFSVIADSLTKNDIVPRFLPENPAQVAREIENAIRNELPKVVIGKLKKFGFGKVSLEKVRILKQDLYYSKINSSISDAIPKIGGRIKIHAENIGFGTKFARYSAGYRSTTLYIIDRMNAAFERSDFEKMGEYLQQLGLSSEQIMETMRGILNNKKPGEEGYQQLKELIDKHTEPQRLAVVDEMSTDPTGVAVVATDEQNNDEPPFPPIHLMR